MKKYRIVEKSNPYSKFYIIQKRWLLFFWVSKSNSSWYLEWTWAKWFKTVDETREILEQLRNPAPKLQWTTKVIETYE
jgi:hypothetical protein